MTANRKKPFFWRALKALGRLLKAVCWLLAAALALALALLLAAGRRIPEPLVTRVTDRLSSEKISVRVDRAAFSLRTGLHLYRPCVLYHAAPGGFERLIYADEVDVAFSRRWPPRLEGLIKEVTVRKLRFPGIPPMKDKPGSPPFRPDFPRLGVFRLTLEDPDILGIHGRRLEGLAEIGGRTAAVRDIAIQWHGADCPAGVRGWVAADFDARLVTTRIRGEALPSYIVPLMGEPVLDAPEVAEEMNAFQSVRPPVKAGADIRVDIDTLDYSLFLTIDAGRCTYKGVPVEWLRGSLSAGDTNGLTTLTVGPLEAKSDTGRLKGRLTYRQETKSIDFRAESTLDLPRLADVIGILNEGELDGIRCDRLPAFAAAGAVSVEKGGGAANRVSGRVSLAEGSVLNLKVKNVAGDFSMAGCTARFDRLSGATGRGGGLGGSVAFSFPGYDPDKTAFEADLELRGIPLADLADAVRATNNPAGNVSGRVALRAKTKGDVLRSLGGSGQIQVRDGLLNRMPIFAGFTDYLAKTVPGVAKLVNQSDGSMSFTIRDGVLSTDSLLIEGSVFSLSGKGTYDIARDRLDFVVRANIFKKKTWLGKITRLVTFPFSRLLLEFHVFGSLGKTDWSYVTILDKITDALD